MGKRVEVTARLTQDHPTGSMWRGGVQWGPSFETHKLSEADAEKVYADRYLELQDDTVPADDEDIDGKLSEGDGDQKDADTLHEGAPAGETQGEASGEAAPKEGFAAKVKAAVQSTTNRNK